MQKNDYDARRVTHQFSKIGRETSIDSLPREKMQRSSASALSDAELLAILLRTGTAKMNVLEVANNLLHEYGSLYNLFQKDWESIRRLHGIGLVKSLELNAIFELAKRSIRRPFHEYKKVAVKSPKQIADVLFPFVKADPRETFYVIALNAKRCFVCEPIKLTRGTSDATVVDPHDIFREVIARGAKRVILAHNHPDANAEISNEDVDLTRAILKVSEAVQIPVDDHIVVWDNGEDFLGYVSMHEKGIL